jgi:hypothetical protein
MTFCESCTDATVALERMLKAGFQQTIMPPDGVNVLSLIAQHGGSGKTRSTVFSGLPWW